MILISGSLNKLSGTTSFTLDSEIIVDRRFLEGLDEKIDENDDYFKFSYIEDSEIKYYILVLPNHLDFG